MTLTVLTYNTLFNRAAGSLIKIIKEYTPDIICLQEMDTDENNLKKINGGCYLLADFCNSFIQGGKIYGLATYYNVSTLLYTGSENLNLSRSFGETLLMLMRLGRSERSVLKSEFTIKSSQKKISIYNIHCSMWCTNNARNRQIVKTFSDIDAESTDPTIVVGDFNYPYGRKKFEQLISRHQLKEATSNIFYTFEVKLFGVLPLKWKNDYVLYRNIKQVKTETIKIKFSDHYPILSIFAV
jgi:endonuclease/exonuclease/phosphatase family metal-dependent hydrolase